MVEQALILQVYDHDAVEQALDRAPGRAGPPRLRRLLAEIHDDPPNTANDFERDLLFLVDEENLRRPVCNGWVCGYQVDFHWPDASSSSRLTVAQRTPTRSLSSAIGRGISRSRSPVGVCCGSARDSCAASLSVSPQSCGRRCAAMPSVIAPYGRLRQPEGHSRSGPLESYPAGGGVTGAVAAAALISPEP